MEFRLYPLTTAYAGWFIWPWERSEEVLRAWAEWTRTVPDEMTSVGRILQIPDLPFAPEPLRGRNIVAVEVAYTGTEDQERIGAELVRPFRDLAPEMDMVATMPAPELVRLHQDPEPPMPGVGGHVMIDEITPEAMSAFVDLTGPRSGSPFLSAEMRHLGGAAGRPAPGGGALSHLDGEGAVFVIGVPMHPEHHELLVRDVKRVETGLAGFGTGACTATSWRSRPRPAASTRTTAWPGCARCAAASTRRPR